MSSIIITLTLLGHFAPLSAPTPKVAVKKPSVVKKAAVQTKKAAVHTKKAAVHIGIYQIHLQEFASIRVYDENGYLRPQALAEFNRINRCLKTGVVLEMDYRLLVELYEAWIAFGMPSVTLFSGCRQAPNASENSRHNFGTAIDYNFDGVTRRELVSWLLSRRDRKSHGVGLGYYPNSYHIHMDVREAHAFWVDLGPAGEKGSRMVADSYHWFATERKQRSRAVEASTKDPEPQATAVNIPAGEPETSATR
jgi:uncharacterized protein YcbK (DUF882 family)